MTGDLRQTVIAICCSGCSDCRDTRGSGGGGGCESYARQELPRTGTLRLLFIFILFIFSQ